MGIFDFQKVKELFDPEKITSNKKLVVYLFFVVIATVFWFLNALDGKYTATVKYPVRYVNLPQNKVVTNQLPERLILKIDANGFDILRYKFSTAFLSNPFDVRLYTNNRLENTSFTSYKLATSQIMGRLERELSSSLNLLSISPDTIEFEFSPILEKTVPIQLNVKNTFEQQFMLGGIITLDSDSVLIKGPSSILDSITVVETEEIVFTELNKSIEKEINLKEIKGIELAKSEVIVNIPVEQFTEATKKVEIKVVNLPDSVLLRLFPGEAKVTYFVGLKRYDKVSHDLFTLEVDYNESLKENNGKLSVKLAGSPGFISNVRFDPQTVTYLIEKKNSLNN